MQGVAVGVMVGVAVVVGVGVSVGVAVRVTVVVASGVCVKRGVGVVFNRDMAELKAQPPRSNALKLMDITINILF